VSSFSLSLQVGEALKTGIPAVNALLAAKLSECRGRGIEAKLETASVWSDIPVADWELCRVLGNLIDNALDAMRGQAGARLTVFIGETLRDFTFFVENNGPAIDPEMMEKIFEPGVSTRGEGRGMGLSIVRKILEPYGGRIEVSSDEYATRFTGSIPKPIQAG